MDLSYLKNEILNITYRRKMSNEDELMLKRSLFHHDEIVVEKLAKKYNFTLEEVNLIKTYNNYISGQNITGMTMPALMLLIQQQKETPSTTVTSSPTSSASATAVPAVPAGPSPTATPAGLPSIPSPTATPAVPAGPSPTATPAGLPSIPSPAATHVGTGIVPPVVTGSVPGGSKYNSIGGGDYKSKYLKYKNKYLNLRSKLRN
jgi:hypothetical protein